MCQESGQNDRPLLAITMGDVNGIGPEIVVKALCERKTYGLCRPLVIGSAHALERDRDQIGASVQVARIQQVEAAAFTYGQIDLLCPEEVDIGQMERGMVDPTAGYAAVAFVTEGVRLTLRGAVDGIVTAPLNKEAMNQAGIRYPGHTELLAHLTDVREVRMILIVGGLRVVHVTVHVSLRTACDLITCDRVFKTIEIGRQGILDLGIPNPRIAVAGLNPHAGEGGLFGDEERLEIAPAVEHAQTLGWNVVGPLPPDTVFFRGARGAFDGIVAMYHDQGHIPLKLIGFEQGVNVTLGLPIVRTSVDHGTAFDIAGKGMADPTSLLRAIELAAVLVRSQKKRRRRAGNGT